MGLFELQVGGLQPSNKTPGPQRFWVPQPDQPTTTDTLRVYSPAPAGLSREKHIARSSSMSRFLSARVARAVGLRSPGTLQASPRTSALSTASCFATKRSKLNRPAAKRVRISKVSSWPPKADVRAPDERSIRCRSWDSPYLSCG